MELKGGLCHLGDRFLQPWSEGSKKRLGLDGVGVGGPAWAWDGQGVSLGSLLLPLRLQRVVEAALSEGQLRPLEPLGHMELEHVGSQVCWR